MTNTTWIQQLERLLTEASRTDRDLILRDVEVIAREINGGNLLDVLGSPEAYARQAIHAFTPELDPNAAQTLPFSPQPSPWGAMSYIVLPARAHPAHSAV